MFKNKIHISAILLLLHFGLMLEAQQDTTMSLSPVTIGATSLRDRMPGERVSRFDSAQLVQSAGMDIGALLAMQGNLYIKSYGLSSLATSSMRGGSAGQTAITWNGVPLQSPMLGLTDLALLPVFLVDDVSVHYGSSGAQWGSGAVGGRIALQNERSKMPGHNVAMMAGVGSFDAENILLKYQFTARRWAISTKAVYNDALNNFTWRINDTLPEKTQTNAAARQWGFMQDGYFQISAKQQLEAHYWRQTNDRQIPPTSAQSKSVARQLDTADRISLQWKYFLQRHTLALKSAFLSESIDYQDDQIKLRALSDFQNLFFEAEDKWAFTPRFTMQVGTNHTRYAARADGYKNGVHSNRTAGFAVAQFSGKRLTAQAGLRQEWLDGSPAPLLPDAGLRFEAFPFLSVKMRAARQYRLPTLNDLYWQPGGNALLQPESGWSYESGLVVIPAPGFTYEITGYRRRIHNWILWSQLEGQSFWSPNNITEVFSRGVEQQLRFLYRLKKSGIDGNISYDYTRSTNEIALSRPQIAAGEQLLYVPVHQAGAGVTVYFHSFSVQYRHRYSGAAEGVNGEIPDWNVGFARVQWAWQWKHICATFFMQSDNVWNKNYRVVERRPMPGRNYQTGIFIQFFQ